MGGPNDGGSVEAKDVKNEYLVPMRGTAKKKLGGWPTHVYALFANKLPSGILSVNEAASLEYTGIENR